MLGVAKVGPRGAKNADEVEAGMLEEAFVFGGENGLYQLWRQVIVTHRAAFLAEAVEEVGDEFRLNFRRAHVRTAAKRADGANDPAVELHGYGVTTRKVRELRWANIQSVALDGVRAHGIFICIGAIAGALEIGDQVVGTPSLPIGDVFGSREDLGGVLQKVAGEPEIDHLRVLDVVE